MSVCGMKIGSTEIRVLHSYLCLWLLYSHLGIIFYYYTFEASVVNYKLCYVSHSSAGGMDQILFYELLLLAWVLGTSLFMYTW